MSQRDSESPIILSLGSINADFQVRVGRRPEISETVLATDFARFGGGKAANVAFLARRLNVDVRLFGHVGDDDLAEQALAPLRAMGVDLADVEQVENCPTGFAMVTVPPDGKKGIVLAANANEVWSEQDTIDVVQTISGAPAGAVLVVDCEVPVTVIERACEASQEAGHTIILDPSPANRVTDALLSMVDVVVPNAAETAQLIGVTCKDVSSAAQAGAKLLEKGVTAACIKLSDGGCVLVEKAGACHVTSVPVDVSDTTGAGDAFAGALAVALVEGRSASDNVRENVRESVRFAVAASHLAVTGYGSQHILPNREQIEDMANRLDVDTNVPFTR